MCARKTSPDERGFERHGMLHTKEYYSWSKIPKNKMCDAWRISFTSFLNDIGHKPTAEHVLIRKDKSKPHGPGNTYWGIKTGQMTLNDGRVVILTLNGKRISQTEICKKFKINIATLRSRLTSGWSIKDAVTIPVDATISEKQKAHPRNYLDKRKVHGMSNTPEYRAWARCVHLNILEDELANDFKAFYRVIGKRPGADYFLTRKDKTQLMSSTNFVWRRLRSKATFTSKRITQKVYHKTGDSFHI